MEEMIWVVCRIWQGGKVDPISAYRSEEQARYAAGASIPLEPDYLIALWTVPLKDAVNV